MNSRVPHPAAAYIPNSLGTANPPIANKTDPIPRISPTGDRSLFWRKSQIHDTSPMPSNADRIAMPCCSSRSENRGMNAPNLGLESEPDPLDAMVVRIDYVNSALAVHRQGPRIVQLPRFSARSTPGAERHSVRGEFLHAIV